MKCPLKYPNFLMNLLVALVVSLVVNFSSLLFFVTDTTSEQIRTQAQQRVVEYPGVGVLKIDPNGHGYLIYESGDSVYVPQQRIRRWDLSEGDRLEVNVRRMHRRRGSGLPSLYEIRRCNGTVFDRDQFWRYPSVWKDLGVQWFFYGVLSWLLLSLLTWSGRRTRGELILSSLGCLLLVGVFYFVAPVTLFHQHQVVPLFLTHHLLNYPIISKCLFALVVSLLYGWLYFVISQRQAFAMENERLKNENLTTRYNMLVGQINPHFFFNSLSSLAMLVREHDETKALNYIDQLSYTFRYIIQNGQNGLIRLEDELQFVEAYTYLFKIRYEDKLFFEVQIDPRLKNSMLPALSLQPLIGNAVKHNAMTRLHPLHVSIRTERDYLVVSNPKIPKLDVSPSTGIGLENLRNRWMLLTGKAIEINDTDYEFTVKLPLGENTDKDA